jgi:hypothetical protein
MADPRKLNFHYIKGNHYRVVHMDGAHGGITPRGGIFAAIYSERLPIPQMTVHKVEGETVADEIREERKTKDGVVREIEVGLTMDLATAQTFHDWLGERIKKLQELTKIVETRSQ